MEITRDVEFQKIQEKSQLFFFQKSFIRKLFTINPYQY